MIQALQVGHFAAAITRCIICSMMSDVILWYGADVEGVTYATSEDHLDLGYMNCKQVEV